ncbi:MAG TPA: MBL fold metallo-hydrolase [Candidatus Limnocylindrales bacterium]
MELVPFRTPGLGDTSYLLASDGEAVLVDPQRDAWRFVDAAKERGWRVTHVLETHVHNDYVSGAMETRAATGAEVVAPARGHYDFAIRGADEGDVLEVGGLRITAAATPGHTPEHLSWFVGGSDGPNDAPPEAVFSGGSLLVGSVGRTDLLGPALANAMAADQQRTLQRFAALPDNVAILPTHGAGSFCSAGPATGKWHTSIGAERFANPVFGAAGDSVDAFRERLSAGFGRYPAYYAHMAGINRAGPRVLGALRLPGALTPEELEANVARGATVVDARARTDFAAGHVEGSINVELDADFASYVGWLVPFGSPVVLVLPDPADESATEAITQLLRIGYDWVPGWLDGGIEAWRASGRPTASYGIVGLGELAAQDVRERGFVLDVRQPSEWRDEGVVPGSTQVFVGDLPARIGELPKDEPITVLCRSGYRASIAASLLDRAGHEVRLVARGGAPNWPGQLTAPDPG